VSILPSPIPHPLDYCPWDLPGWVHEALDWVIGVEWPDGNECHVWDLADRWYAVADVLAGPRDDAVGAAAEVRSGYGGVGAVADAFDTAWRRVAEGDDAPLSAIFAVTGELGRLVESCGCDIEGAKIEVWIELGLLVVELLSLAVAAVLTAGAASPAAGVAMTTSRMVVQQIFKRLMTQLARKALKEGMKEAAEHAAKQVVKGGVRGFARRAALSGLAEAGEEAGVSLATQAYQNSTGRAHGLDLADVGMSAVGGFAGGAVAPLAGLGRHADGRLGRVGEHLGREVTGETIAEGAAGLATGQGVSLEDLARAAVSGAGGAATGQADTALHHRLDGQLAALGVPPVDLSALAPPTADAAPEPGHLPLQRSSSDLAADAVPVVQAVAGVDRLAEQSQLAVAGPEPEAGSSTIGLAPDHDALTGPGGAGGALAGATHTDGAVAGLAQVDGAPSGSKQVDGSVDGSTQTAGARLTEASVGVESSRTAAASPTLSAVAVDPDVAAPHRTVLVDPGQVAAPAPAPTELSAPAVAASHTAVGGVLPQPGTSVIPVTGDRSAAGLAGAQSGPALFPRPAPPADLAMAGRSARTADPDLSEPAARATIPATERAPGPPPTGPDDRPTPPPRFPLLASLAPGTARVTHDIPSLEPFSPRSHQPVSPERQAALAADREALDRRRYQGYLDAQRHWYEDKRRHREVDWLRERADYHQRWARERGEHADELRRRGADLAAERWRREAYEASRESYELRDRAREVLDGTVVPEQVLVEDDTDFYRINDDVADLAVGAVETPDRSALTGDDDPPPIDRTRRYGVRGGLRPPLALHQTDLERRMPRAADGTVLRTADPREGGWFGLANDGGPQADPTRGINCVDCTLSLYETWMHGRPRVSAPRTFDGYLDGDVRRPVSGEDDGPQRIEASTGGRFQKLCGRDDAGDPVERRDDVERGYRDLHRQLLDGGHGSYAFLISSWEGGGSHAWVAVNQNGTVLYLDPQTGRVGDRPLYPHTGWPAWHNVIAIDALVLDPGGEPLPLPGRGRGDFAVLPDLPPRYAGDPPDFNHVHLLGEPGLGPGHTAPAGVPASPDQGDPARPAVGNDPARLADGSDRARSDGGHGAARPDGGHGLARPADGPGPAWPDGHGAARPADGPDPAELRAARLLAHSDRVSAMRSVRDVLAAGTDLDQVFAAGVTPAELAQHLDPATLRGLAPRLDAADARDVAALFGDPRVQRMLDQTWEAPPRDEPLLGEALVRQLTQRPDLARMILATPELAASLTARPLTLHHLASHQQAIDVLGEVLDDIAARGPEAVAAEGEPPPQATPLTPAQRNVTARLAAHTTSTRQSGFDLSRRHEEVYRSTYVDQLYADAAVAQQELNALARRLAGDHGRPGWRTGPKGRARVLDKLVEYKNDASRLKDLAGAKVQFFRLDDIYRALDQLAADPRVVILDIKDRFLKPQQSGYRDVLLNIQTSNGHVGEFRLHLESLDGVAEWEHALYGVRRDLEALSLAEDRPLTPVEAALRAGLLRRVQDAFWNQLAEGL
jgi:hypothetical protein